MYYNKNHGKSKKMYYYKVGKKLIIYKSIILTALVILVLKYNESN